MMREHDAIPEVAGCFSWCNKEVSRHYYRNEKEDHRKRRSGIRAVGDVRQGDSDISMLPF